MMKKIHHTKLGENPWHFMKKESKNTCGPTFPNHSFV